MKLNRLIGRCAKIVERLLISSPRLRDNDQQLVANVWFVQINKNQNIKTMSAKEFLHELAKGNVLSSESITRCRRKLQEENIHLRGKRWNERHRMQKDVKEELKNSKDYASS